jgi:TPP-dependent 2-oxoacid decarboxylase
MTHSPVLGVSLRAISPSRIRKRVEDADLIIALGMLLTDIESGGRAPSEALCDRSI